ncbi:4Fe-4S binding domain-containing protein [Algoriphagus alkaliphilus]|uniref:4Fe-4S binding domain-containing protein n=1 Tax=Algoriphagus alkaliphilus TaxID=279824 RepID=A0A1G5WW75_9BACT|nr:4Fe-4S binding protein [Algoriphagus alkaliphilus]MBA4301802.1 4Fe-4S binding protein [Cyclobacterium sp.]SDA62262.1 4Fe-4S binding domain-containing protein [Algoriphagus alkaliphilus]
MTWIEKIGLGLFLVGLTTFLVIPFLGTYSLSEELVKANTKAIHQDKMAEILAPMYGQEYSSNFTFLSAFGEKFDAYNDDLKSQQLWDEVIWDDYSFALAKAGLKSPVRDSPWLFFALAIGLAVLGGFLYNFRQHADEPEGIKNNGIFHSKLKNRGWIGMITGFFLILFYVVLYWFPAYLVNLVWMVNPISEMISGNPASQWFLYGLIYTLAIIVMGIRMFRKYRGNKYQQLRTASVMFFQTAFAFLIPEVLVLLNQPYFDFKNIWPLDYDFFYDYQIATFLSSGGVGMFMLIWGILLIIIGVPVFTYFFGKRWYCSWVCGCGGLAETVGDPFRQLSDKSVKAWKYERWIVHSVLVLAVVMTGVTIANYFSGFSFLGNVTNQLHSFYGFAIGSAFAGVVGTGFYPFMGNRVWCRFGCPLAAYLGIVQRFKSRFRITTNGGQCISCGNCSTYCEMGIDVRWYAQRGQNIVRSSCVGCGVCSAVCPRGVLKLENGPEENRINDLPIIIGNDSIKIHA